MAIFEIIIALLLAGAFLAAVSRRIGAPYPALVALAGAALALVPGLPELVLDPELALALFVAPVLVDAAFDASVRDLRTNWRPVASLALGAVALTIVAAAIVARLLVPEMPWSVAIALGAIIAPPDAAAATAVLKVLRPPHRLMVILEGESLFNDASALLIYRLAVGVTLTGALSGATLVPTLLLVTLGSLILAFVMSRATLWISSKIEDVPTAIIFQFCGTFGVWILAESLHLSGIITMVVYAMLASRRAPEIVPARIRVPAWAVWETMVFVLNVLAFILVGFQLKAIVNRVDYETGRQYAIVAVLLTITAILARILWVTLAAGWSRWRCKPTAEGRPGPRDAVALNAKAAAVVGWCGMRGAVTLAAALALPTGGDGGQPYPFRDLILVTAFGVVLGTLVIQGLTLRPLLLTLRIQDDGAVEQEAQHARLESLRAAMAAIEQAPPAPTTELVRHRYELQLKQAEAAARGGMMATAGGSTVSAASSIDAEIVRTATAAQRTRLIALRNDGTIGDAAFQLIQEELDWAELDWQQFLRSGTA